MPGSVASATYHLHYNFIEDSTMTHQSLRLSKPLLAFMLLILVSVFAQTDANALAAPSHTTISMAATDLTPVSDPVSKTGLASVATENCTGTATAAAQFSCDSRPSPLLIVLIAGSLMATVLVLLLTHRDQEML